MSCMVCMAFILFYCFVGIRECGRDFSTIASILGTKTAQHVETFYNTYKVSFDLDLLCKDGEVVNIC